ncbi:MAG TPA: ornithine cyclodeaminase family protein [Candidatus Angelobacter sp.]|nr:ornithine cyclodeaminase family protein [Candidatus Angelobacter sp.]
MTRPKGTLLLSRADVAELLTVDDCIAAVESAFWQHGQGNSAPPKVLGMPSTDGGFHIKAALLGSAPYFAAKLNGNFFYNQQRFAMPNIQGVIVLCDASNGFPLAVMDSIEVTILRTGAATAVAARHLARPDSKVVTICGCGNQGRVQLRALHRVLPVERVYAFDRDEDRARAFAAELSGELKIAAEPAHDLPSAVRRSDICVTCTPAKKHFLRQEHVAPGTFVAGVGADNEDKQELDPRLLASSKVVADVLEQCAEIGDLHHAIAAGLMQRGDVHAELAEVVAGKKAGRTSQEEITIFDSTGTALQDVAAAAVVYERARNGERGGVFRF